MATLAHDVSQRLWHHARMDIVHLVQSALAPVFLLSGVGVTLGVLTNRLARIVDRARALEVNERGARAPTAYDDLSTLARRAHYINIAIALCSVSALLVALVVVMLFAIPFVPVNLSVTIALLFVSSMLSLTGAFVAFLFEVRLAMASLRFGARTPPAATERSRTSLDR